MAAYDNQPGFRIDSVVSRAYHADLMNTLGSLSPGLKTLELGCGSGVFTELLHSLHFAVIGVDASEIQLAEARARLPDVQFRQGDIEASELTDTLLSQHGTFDLLICRYVIHELADPIEAFSLWKRLLKPEGKLLLIENAWQRTDWGAGDWGKRSNMLPLACTQTWATAVYCLHKAGYQHIQASWMDAVNCAFREQNAEGFRLYKVIANAGTPLSDALG